MPKGRGLIIEIVLMVAIGLILAFVGPFGSYAMGGLATRIAYWVPMAVIGYAIFRPMAWLAGKLANRFALPRPAADLVAVALAAIPGSFAVVLFGGHPLSADIDPERFLSLYVQVVILGGIIQTIFYLVGSPRVEPSEAPITRPPFLDRLPPAWADRLVALEMEDHYVRAHGPDGRSELILMRMADAERELEGADGARIHRSWWVSRGSIEKVRREGRALRLDLGDGLVAPVSRERASALREDGWPL